VQREADDPPGLTVLLVDDEPPVRAALRQALVGQRDLTVVGEAGDGLAAIVAIEELRPDLVLLDVQMPGCDGFDVLAQVDAQALPIVVFVTAYEQYALRAFEAHAIDYVLKPFDDARLLAAIARARQWLGRRTIPDPNRLSPMLADVAAGRRRDRFIVKHAGRLRLVPAAEVHWIEARGNYVHLHHADGTFLLRETIAALATTLDPARFVRVHRSAIVALPEVVERERLPGGDHAMRLRNGATVPLGRAFRAEFDAKWRGV